MNNEIGIGELLGVFGMVGVYVWLKVWMYKKEYKGNENTKDKKDI